MYLDFLINLAANFTVNLTGNFIVILTAIVYKFSSDFYHFIDRFVILHFLVNPRTARTLLGGQKRESRAGYEILTTIFGQETL